MEKRKVIKRKDIQHGLMLELYVIIYLILDKFNASATTWWIVGIFCALVFIATIVVKLTEKPVDIFEEINKKSEKE